MSWDAMNPLYRDLATKHLTDKQRTVLRHKINGHSFRQIAVHMNIHEATVRGHYDAARRRMRKAIQEAA
jgi:Sigma-70, region 4.